jgi:hypothetical protein
MLRIGFSYFFLFFSASLDAQINNISYSQKLSMQAAVSENNIDATAILSNQAARYSKDELNYGLFSEKKYLMNELNQLVFFLNKNNGKSGITIIQDYNGFSECYTMQSSFGFSKTISNNTSIGLRINYFFRHIKDNQKSQSLGSEISFIHKLSKEINTGLIIVNPQNVFIKSNVRFSENEVLFKWGLLYDVSKQFNVFLDLMKSDIETVGIVAGCSYSFNKRVDVKYSFSVQEMSNRLTIGFDFNKMKIKLMNSFHPQLGYFPSFMLLSNLNKKVRSI